MDFIKNKPKAQQSWKTTKLTTKGWISKWVADTQQKYQEQQLGSDKAHLKTRNYVLRAINKQTTAVYSIQEQGNRASVPA